MYVIHMPYIHIHIHCMTFFGGLHPIFTYSPSLSRPYVHGWFMAASAWSVFFKGSARTWVSPSSTVILGSEKTVGILWDWPMGFGDENQVRKNLRGKSSQTSMTSQMHQMGIEKSHTSQNFPEAKKTKVEIVFKHRKTQTSALKRITKKTHWFPMGLAGSRNLVPTKWDDSY